MAAEPDEQALVYASQNGDLDAFNLLVDRYQNLLFRVALRMMGDEDQAADAAQMAWISAFRHIGGFRGGHLQTWLVRVTVNTCYDELRRGYRRREVPLARRDEQGAEVELDTWLVDPAPTVEQAMETLELDKHIQACLESLPTVYRAMLIMIDIEGLSYEEAARAARVPLGTVRSRLARARLAMRQRLDNTPSIAPTAGRVSAQGQMRCR